LKATAVAVLKLEPLITTSVPTDPEVGANESTVGATSTVKLPALMPVPPGLVTETGPVVVPAATVAVIWRSESIVKPAAEVPLKATAVAPVNSLPEITTSLPTGPEVGVNESTIGATRTVKLPALIPVPAGLVTETGPLVVPAATVAVIWRSESIVKPAAGVPLKATAVAVLKPLPELTTSVPTGPEVGANELTAGALPTKKLAALAPLPAGFATEIGPVVAPAGTFAWIWVGESTTNPGAEVPLKLTDVAPVKPLPVIVTWVPTGPPAGPNEVTLGADPTKKLAAL
jgi:hypothetical protein